MKLADPDELRTIVSSIVSRSAHASLFNGADIDADNDSDDGDFIRIVIHFNNLDDLSEDDVDTIVSSIENAVIRKDDRFPSVRFSEP
ncbi:hypothetical protein [Methylobacterium platani]|uniref:hypothetical protein n=1 Tax=Methylobacterium platani TaxID=427683 RepID=UPI000B22923E|nr:hypothetical protein [Methylobacterium platani]